MEHTVVGTISGEPQIILVPQKNVISKGLDGLARMVVRIRGQRFLLKNIYGTDLPTGSAQTKIPLTGHVSLKSQFVGLTTVVDHPDFGPTIPIT
jgi:hypothetical protein